MIDPLGACHRPRTATLLADLDLPLIAVLCTTDDLPPESVSHAKA